jgi:hypothetical protein
LLQVIFKTYAHNTQMCREKCPALPATDMSENKTLYNYHRHHLNLTTSATAHTSIPAAAPASTPASAPDPHSHQHLRLHPHAPPFTRPHLLRFLLLPPQSLPADPTQSQGRAWRRTVGSCVEIGHAAAHCGPTHRAGSSHAFAEPRHCRSLHRQPRRGAASASSGSLAATYCHQGQYRAVDPAADSRPAVRGKLRT